MKRPNPVNGRTLVPQNPALVYTKEDLRQAIAEAGLKAKRAFVMNLGISDLIADNTPSSRWKQEGRKDDFAELLNQERGSLCLGNHTDDELAAELFIYGGQTPEERSRSMIQGKPSSIAYLMAGKERIRWLSRHLDASLANEKRLASEVEDLKVTQNTLWNFLVEDYIERWEACDLLANDVAGNEEFERVFFTRACKLLPKEIVQRKLDEVYEDIAKNIYGKWADQPEYRPWVNRGNSIKQAKARSMSRNVRLFAAFINLKNQ